MPEENLDAKASEESSTSTDANSAVDSSTTAKKDAKTETTESSTEVKEATTLEEAASQAGEKHREGTEKKDEEAKTDSTEKKEEAAVESEKDASNEEVPFHEHPRWQQVNKELGEAKPLAERAKKLDQYLTETGISNAQFEDMLKIGALMNTDPAKALEALRPYVEALESYQGLRLPDDLKKKLDDGVIDEETAKETAILRARKDVDSRTAQQRAELQLSNSIGEALVSWETAKRKADPDFDKKYDLLLDRFNRLTQANKEKRSPQNSIALAEQAYKEVNDKLGIFVPKPAAKKVLTSTGASVQTKTEPETFEEAVAAAGAKYRES